MTKLFCSVAVAAMLAAASASAAVVQYTDQTAFDLAAGALTVETFAGFALGDLAPSTDLGAFSVSTNSAASIADSGNNVNGSRFLQANLTSSVTPGGVPATLTFTFDTAILAFSANFASLNNNITRTFVTVGGTVFNPIPNSPSFLGYVSDTAFTTVTFTNPMGGGNNDSFGVDNLRYAAVAVPEPATWALMIGGFGLAGSALRRRRLTA